MSSPKIYEAICNITCDLSKSGIAKDRKNQQQGYAFRGIDDVYLALSPLLAKHKVCILPRVTSRNVAERTTKNGAILFYTTLIVEFDFVSAEDGSKHTAITVGEAMDSGDKSSNKAQSAAYKYACLQTFCIPTEGDNDADATTYQVAAAKNGIEQVMSDWEHRLDDCETGEHFDEAARQWFKSNLADPVRSEVWDLIVKRAWAKGFKRNSEKKAFIHVNEPVTV